MANIKKSFNFRNGVQVDDDNLKVSATGLVGIGTTVPTEALDVRGSLVVSGVTSAVTLQAGVATITTLNPTEIIGAGVSIKSGIVTASSGIITYFGDGINLLNLPTSQWEDTIVGAGVSSIYNTGGNVGIATTAALFTLQVGNDVNSNQKGVGISSFGDIKASGIVTATGFVGGLTGDVTGNVTGNVVGGTVISGIATFSGNIDANGDLDVDGHTDLDSLNVSGSVGIRTTNPTSNLQVDGTSLTLINKENNNNTLIKVENTGPGNAGVNIKNSNGEFTFLANDRLRIQDEGAGGIERLTILNGNVGVNSIAPTAKLDVNGLSELDDVNVSGASTFFGRIEGAMTNNVIPFLYSNLAALPNAGDYHGAFAHVHSEGRAYFAHAGQWWELVNKESDGRIGTGSEELNVGDINSAGIITCGTELNSPLIGVGTVSPAHDIQVRKSGDTEIQVTSDTGSAGITVGREAGSGKTNNAEFRYGFTAGSDYNTAQSLDIINYGTDNFNYFLSANNPGAVTGNYFWHKGLNNVRLMTLTNTGRLGIGITAPTDELHVIGGATVSGNIVVGNNVTVSGNIIGNVQGSLTGNVAGTLAGNTNTTVGISTLNNLSIAGIATAARLRANKFAIGENPNLDLVSIFISNTDKVFVNDVGQVGIKTTIALTGVGVNGSSTNAVFNSIGIGITQFTSAAVDLRDAGTATSRYMIPPKVDNSGRAGLQNLVSGAMIYNTSINKLQVYNGSAWETVTSS